MVTVSCTDSADGAVVLVVLGHLGASGWDKVILRYRVVAGFERICYLFVHACFAGRLGTPRQVMGFAIANPSTLRLANSGLEKICKQDTFRRQSALLLCDICCEFLLKKLTSPTICGQRGETIIFLGFETALELGGAPGGIPKVSPP